MSGSGEENAWRSSVGEFLRAFQFAVAYHPEQVWWDPKKDWDADLDALQLTRHQALRILREDLAPKHLHGGPEPDDVDFADAVVFKFRYPVPGAGDAYIKLALKQHPRKRDILLPKVWSCKPWNA
jgi:hypothetical protein